MFLTADLKTQFVDRLACEQVIRPQRSEQTIWGFGDDCPLWIWCFPEYSSCCCSPDSSWTPPALGPPKPPDFATTVVTVQPDKLFPPKGAASLTTGFLHNTENLHHRTPSIYS